MWLGCGQILEGWMSGLQAGGEQVSEGAKVLDSWRRASVAAKQSSVFRSASLPFDRRQSRRPTGKFFRTVPCGALRTAAGGCGGTHGALLSDAARNAREFTYADARALGVGRRVSGILPPGTPPSLEHSPFPVRHRGHSFYSRPCPATIPSW